MSKVYMEEIDFFEMEKRKAAASKPSSPERPPSSFRGIQSVVSRINPQLLKTVMAARHAGSLENASPWGSGKPSHLSSTPSSPTSAPGDDSRRTTPSRPSPPAVNLASGCSPSPLPPSAPLTIFYNGTVIAVDLPHDKAEAIMRMAEAGIVGSAAGTPESSVLNGDQQGDMPIARRKSLQRFLEKRKERLASALPYRKVTTPHRC